MSELAKMTWEVAKSFAVITGSVFLIYFSLVLLKDTVKSLIKRIKKMKKNRG